MKVCDLPYSRITEETICHDVLFRRHVCNHILICRTSFEPRKRCVHTKEQEKLCMLLDVGLQKDRGLVRIYTACQNICEKAECILTENICLCIAGRQGMPVSNDKIAVILIL